MNDFLIDKQTLTDLQLLNGPDTDRSILSLFNFTATIAGKALLRDFFDSPSVDIFQLQKRSENIQFFAGNPVKLSLDEQSLDFIEFYIRSLVKPMRFSLFHTCRNGLKNYFSPKQDYYTKKKGALDLYDILEQASDFCKLSKKDNEIITELKLLTDTVLKDLKLKKQHSYRIFRETILIDICDFAFRNTHLEPIKRILHIIYEIDVYQSIAQAASAMNLSFPTYITSGKQRIELEGLFHPLLANPVSNDVYFDADKNVCLLTGANMAGKSTLIKSVAIAFYLAHIGFPVPARQMRTHVFDGLLTSINLSDDLSRGYSHFYSEVLRVKWVLEEIMEKKRLLVIFDELFRGTNVKDASESSTLIIQKLSGAVNSFFIISTHLTEAAIHLKDHPNINFLHFQSSFIDNTPSFNYKLLEGITDERLGWWILKREGINDLLDSLSNAQ
ncbi:MutS-like protein [Anseongella ginsenosidimutans]|uniref:MutS-like protein n=1 Tax=Anseongella ginsenosidimutans TaxID=496056 RepID=A0A4R3KMC2_9SPHI|nr:hypothetical protein [Anseongella ginsenosidimutans]QEC53582.1 hypothetical protein FRZ59_15385 [Anseongella ginsenosidimutans]TCS84652.1 MutS-like protein [Anseongella ginsenosidimutans]